MVTVVENDFPEFLYYGALSFGQVAIDIETSGLDRQKDKIGCITMYVPLRGTFVLRNIYDAPKTLKYILECRAIQKIFHYAVFDLAFLVRDFNVYPRNIACTKIAANIYDPSKTKFWDPNKQKASHSLAALVFSLMDGEKLDKSIATSNWFSDELRAEQLQYVEKDVMYLIDILSLLEREIKTQGRYNLLKEHFSYIPARVITEVQLGLTNVYSYD